MSLLFALWQDEAGFIISAEMLLVATILVLSLVVGLAEVSTSINNELVDIAFAFGQMNQSCNCHRRAASSTSRQTINGGNRHVYGGQSYGGGMGDSSIMSMRPRSTPAQGEGW